MHRYPRNALVLASLVVGIVSAKDPWEGHVLQAAGTPVSPKVDVRWDRYYDSAALEGISWQIAAAYPGLVHMDVIGKSREGRDIWCLTVTDFSTGAPGRKPGTYVQGNIHGNEIQGGEVCLYMAWYLSESHGDVAAIQDLLAEKVFYITPTINPDSRDSFIHQANHHGSPRGSAGYVEGFRDLDGDGNIAWMRQPDPYGLWKKSVDAPGGMVLIDDPKEVEVVNGEPRARQPSVDHYRMTREGEVGIDPWDNGVGGPWHNSDDPNCDWGWAWDSTPEDKLLRNPSRAPFAFPETQAVRDFFNSHPNISAAYSLHNQGGSFINAGVGNTPADKLIYSNLARFGLRVLPSYSWHDRGDGKKTGREGVQGGDMEIDWMFGKRGVYAFIIEQWSILWAFQDGRSKVDWDAYLHEYDQSLLFGAGFIPWHDATDPSWGKVEVGGPKKNFLRLEPGFLLESLAHRILAFCVHTCYETPKLSVDRITATPLDNGTIEVTAVVSNSRLLPTHSGPDLRWQIVRPDYVTLTCAGEVISGGQGDPTQPTPNLLPQSGGRVELSNIDGHASLQVRWIVRGSGPYVVTVDSVKGGVASGKLEQRR